MRSGHLVVGSVGGWNAVVFEDDAGGDHSLQLFVEDLVNTVGRP